MSKISLNLDLYLARTLVWSWVIFFSHLHIFSADCKAPKPSTYSPAATTIPTEPNDTLVTDTTIGPNPPSDKHIVENKFYSILSFWCTLFRT